MSTAQAGATDHHPRDPGLACLTSGSNGSCNPGTAAKALYACLALRGRSSLGERGPDCRGCGESQRKATDWPRRATKAWEAPSRACPGSAGTPAVPAPCPSVWTAPPPRDGIGQAGQGQGKDGGVCPGTHQTVGARGQLRLLKRAGTSLPLRGAQG